MSMSQQPTTNEKFRKLKFEIHLYEDQATLFNRLLSELSEHTKIEDASELIMHVLENYARTTVGFEKVFEAKKVSALHRLQLLDNGVELPEDHPRVLGRKDPDFGLVMGLRENLGLSKNWQDEVTATNDETSTLTDDTIDNMAAEIGHIKKLLKQEGVTEERIQLLKRRRAYLNGVLVTFLEPEQVKELPADDDAE